MLVMVFVTLIFQIPVLPASITSRQHQTTKILAYGYFKSMDRRLKIMVALHTVVCLFFVKLINLPDLTVSKRPETSRRIESSSCFSLKSLRNFAMTFSKVNYNLTTVHANIS